ncbi:MAG: prolyl oligopeptidase family serine peptidase [Dysgonamonadaceae bacterium]|jgi:dipeptidyl aminopeptidase/acylaminoacyl peptidase|nr:prolyl oligopeptidase family serine peptidase [Dysgonamonadaceae bacterium]
MTYIKHSILFLFILLSASVLAQEEIKVSKLKVSPLIPVYNPLLIDTADVNKKGFDNKLLLQTQIDLQTVRKSKEVLTAKENGIVSMPFATYDSKMPSCENAIQLLAFNIDADRYCKAELSITSTDMFEVYVNSKKEKAKETKEDSLAKAKEITVDLTLEPFRYEVIIKRLANVKNFNESELKIFVKPSKNDSAAVITVNTDTKRRISIQDILDGNRVTSCSLSPSGKYYLINFKNGFPGGKSTNSLELREIQTNKLIYRFPSDVYPKWLHKEDKLIYSRSGANEKDLFILELPAFEEKKIASDIKMDYYEISPDNQFIIITNKSEIPADKGDLKRVLSLGDRSGSFRNRNSLYLYSLKDKMQQQLTFGRTNVRLADVSPDSEKILFFTSEEISERPFHSSTLYEMDLNTLKVDTLFKDNFISNAVYSPDMKKILITGSSESFNGAGLNILEGQIPNSYDNQAFIYTRKTNGIDPVTKNFNPNVLDVQWAQQDGNIYIRAEDKDYVRIYQYDTSSGKFTALDLPEDIIASFQIAETGTTALFRGESTANAYRVYHYDIKTKKSLLLADPFKEYLDELSLSQVKSWSFTTDSGSLIDGRYYLPYNYEAGKKYPMVVYYYGGTSPTSRIFESTYPLQTYAAQGYVVLVLQPSGTTGFGQEFSARHVNAWGKPTAQEIIEGTRKFCSEHDFVNSNKIGCIGASYGGFMTQYVITQTDLFAAAISHAGISSIASYWGEGYWGYAYSGAASAYSYPWNNQDLYVKQSPLFNADKITTPLLLLHGTADTNVPIGESIQMFNALRILGKTVEFVQVQGENHAIYDYKKRIEWNKTIHAWFAKWLKDQPEWWDALYPEK